MRGERGAGSVLAVGIVAAVVAAFLLAAGLASALEARHRAETAADAAALAGADTALGNATGDPCTRAVQTAVASGARVDACAQRGDLVRVTCSVPFAGVPIAAIAVAGPPPGSG